MMTGRLAFLTLLSCSVALCQPAEDRIAALTAKAQAAQQSGDTRAAIQAYEEILRLRPGWAEVEFNLGALYQVEKRFPESLGVLASALRHDPSIAPAHLFTGIAYLNTGQYAKARVSLERFLQLRPADPEARFFLAQAYFALDDFASAASEYRKQAELSPDRAQVFYHLGESYLALARRAMEALQVHPAGEYYMLLLSAEARDHQGYAGGEEELVRKAAAVDPKRSEAYTALGSMSLKKGAAAEAKAHFEEALRRDPLDCEAQQGWSEAARALGQKARAKPSQCSTGVTAGFLGVPRFQPDDAPATYRSFRLLMRLAEQSLEKLAALAPHSYLLVLMRAETLEEQHRYEEAAREYERAAAMSSQDASPWIQFARFQCKLDRFDAAVSLLRRALAINPYSPQAHTLLGEAYFLKNDWKAAVPHLEVAVKNKPTAAQSRIYLARSLETLGRLQEAVAVLESAPADPDGRIHAVLASCYRAQGRSDAAASAQAVAEERRAQPRLTVSPEKK